ncbi:Subunit of heteropentameric Replication factor C (RF-C) [Taxawa tesnikishii (nom. ined.)]|nr:Subunit of heteropentameric Replication factor C (RF-C) [Dothideales sp. JES 119]
MEDGVIEMLIKCADGDLRKAITFLQSAARLVGAQPAGGSRDEDAMDMDMDSAPSSGKLITVRSIEEIAGVIPDSTIDRLLQAMQPRSKGSVYDSVAGVVTGLIAEGWSATQVVTQLYDKIAMNDAIPDRQKNKIVMSFSEADKRLVDGADEHLAILDLSLQIAAALAGS